MKKVLTKKEILDWYSAAKYNLNLRKDGKHPTRVRISDADYQAYTRSIERYFKQLQLEFNKRLYAKTETATR